MARTACWRGNDDKGLGWESEVILSPADSSATALGTEDLDELVHAGQLHVWLKVLRQHHADQISPSYLHR